MYTCMNNAQYVPCAVYNILHTAVPIYARAQYSVNARIVTHTYLRVYYAIFICIYYYNVCAAVSHLYIILLCTAIHIVILCLYYSMCVHFFPRVYIARARSPAAGQTAATSLYYYVRRYNLNNNFFFSHFLPLAPEIIQMSQ